VYAAAFDILVSNRTCGNSAGKTRLSLEPDGSNADFCRRSNYSLKWLLHLGERKFAADANNPNESLSRIAALGLEANVFNGPDCNFYGMLKCKNRQLVADHSPRRFFSWASGIWTSRTPLAVRVGALPSPSGNHFKQGRVLGVACGPHLPRRIALPRPLPRSPRGRSAGTGNFAFWPANQH